jgi:uncharacterized protein
MSAELLTGRVMHRRLRPVQHHFSYGVFFLRLPLTRLQEAGIAINRPALCSFHFRDHGARDGSHPLAWIRALLAREGIEADGEVWLQCFPRVLGYVFNPVSFWFCEDRDGRLKAVLAEVNNTFGERHAYLLRAEGTLEARKVFHVSPFFPVAGHYRFRFDEHAGRRLARIDYCDEAGPLLYTSISGQPQPLTRARLAVACLTHPFMTFAIMARIHWQALRLWVKRVPFFAKPPAPAEEPTR